MNNKVMVLLSGGLDSSTVATMAVQEFSPKNVVALTLSYGQKHVVELNAAKAVAKYLGIEKHYIRSLPKMIFEGFGCSLIDSGRGNPEITYEEIYEKDGPSPTYVPFRNGIFLSIAAAFSIVENCGYLYYGAHSEDFTYPDCSPEFNEEMASAIRIGTYSKVRLVVPLQCMNKTEVVRTAIKIGTPTHLTYSCYNGTYPSCGKCPSCLCRIQAFKKAEYEDTIPYNEYNENEKSEENNG